jgi:hypothetical protein
MKLILTQTCVEVSVFYGMQGLNKTFLFEKYWYDAHPSKYFDGSMNKGS